jgi:hypothetical protein
MRIVTTWHHRMAIRAASAGSGATASGATGLGATRPVAAAPPERTQFRDTLEVGAGVLTPLAWLGFWVFWQLRARQLRRLAPGWAKQFGGAGTPTRAGGAA